MTTQILQWSIWGLSLAAGTMAVLALLKLRLSERFLPHWEELKEIDALLPARKDELRQTTDTIESHRKEVAELEVLLGHLKILKEWQDANPEAPARIQQLMTDLERCNSELSAVQSKLAQEETKIDEVLGEVTRLSHEKTQLADQIPLLKSQLADLYAQESKLRNEVQELEKHRRDLNNGVSILKDKCLQTEQKLEKLESQAEACEKRLIKDKAESDKAKAERDSAKAELEGLKTSLETYRALVENLNNQFQATGIGATDVTKSLEDLSQPALCFSFTGRANLDEQAALTQFSKHLTAKGLHYPKRVQLAFHTSLKAAHINPLVVLAGVSGTGKSALPMAYAEAVGMNSLSLAVQPGWSGPQDLMGFYNYLERKYKATELARALAQMSPFSGEDLAGLEISSRKNQMLLLLLDEMNLARIEYYFSDFLSRLEQRRGRNVDDPQRRRDVSILIDAGSLPEGQSPRFIFPGLNVLFVGTMNEDESTQSLSDKVIDRANVLRFGAPKDLKAENAPTVSPNTKFLPYTTWAEWGQAYQGNGLEEEKKTLTELNGALEAVNRPFGHRVYRAILDYMANYPGAMRETDFGDNRRNALADQIEQKIIPKLRGIDTQDDTATNCLDRVGQLIESLNDAELNTAFIHARQQHLFEWYGVKRA